MEIKEQLTKVNFNAMSNKENKYIVIHYVGAVSTAKNNADYFYSADRKASAHYVCDEGNIIYQCVFDTHAAYAVGDKQKYTNGGAQLKGKCTNSNSISIEMVSHTDSKGNYYIPEATINHAVELTRALMSKYHIPSSNVVTHHMCTGKLCPRPMCYDAAGKAKWAEFKAKLTGVNQAPQKEEEEVTQEQFNSMMKTYLSGLSKQEGAAWSEDAREWAISKGIVTGDGNGNYQWKSSLTREQMAIMLMRFAELMGK